MLSVPKAVLLRLVLEMAKVIMPLATLTPTSTYDTSSTSTMSTLAADLTDALKLSATGGVDAQAATYGVYAHLTGAESVKLEAGMSSVTFSNGIKINFNELTTSDVSVITSTTTAPDPINIAEHQVTVTGSWADRMAIDLSALFPGGQTLGEGTEYTLTIGGVSVTTHKQVMIQQNYRSGTCNTNFGYYCTDEA